MIALLCGARQPERCPVQFFTIHEALSGFVRNCHVCHVDIIRKPFRWVNGQTVAVDTVAEERQLIAVTLPGWRPEMPGVVPPFSPVIRMGGMIGRKR